MPFPGWKTQYKDRRIIQLFKAGRSVIPIKLRDFIREINLKQGKVKPVDPELRKELMIRFKPDIKKVEKLIGRSLSVWDNNWYIYK